jgi:hypothetical protein
LLLSIMLCKQCPPTRRVGGSYGSLGLGFSITNNNAASPWLSLDSCGLAVNANKYRGYGASQKCITHEAVGLSTGSVKVARRPGGRITTRSVGFSRKCKIYKNDARRGVKCNAPEPP